MTVMKEIEQIESKFEMVTKSVLDYFFEDKRKYFKEYNCRIQLRDISKS